MDELRVQQLAAGDKRAQLLGGFADAATAGGGEGRDGLARQVIALAEAAHHQRRVAVPDRKADQNAVVVGEVFDPPGGGDALLGKELPVAAGQRVLPIQVRGAIGLHGLDLVEICLQRLGRVLRKARRRVRACKRAGEPSGTFCGEAEQRNEREMTFDAKHKKSSQAICSLRRRG